MEKMMKVPIKNRAHPVLNYQDLELGLAGRVYIRYSVLIFLIHLRTLSDKHMIQFFS